MPSTSEKWLDVIVLWADTAELNIPLKKEFAFLSVICDLPSSATVTATFKERDVLNLDSDTDPNVTSEFFMHVLDAASSGKRLHVVADLSLLGLAPFDEIVSMHLENLYDFIPELFDQLYDGDHTRSSVVRCIDGGRCKDVTAAYVSVLRRAMLKMRVYAAEMSLQPGGHKAKLLKQHWDSMLQTTHATPKPLFDESGCEFVKAPGMKLWQFKIST